MQAKYEVKNKEGWEITVQAKYSAEDFKKAVDEIYRKTKHKYRIDGFRMGKAPRHVIEKAYGEDIFFQEAVEYAADICIPQIIKELDIMPLAPTSIGDVKIEDDKSMEMDLTYYITPEFELKDYKGIEADKAAVNVTDEMVDERINQELDKNSRIIDSDKPTKSGDIVNISFEGSIDGELFEGGSSDDHDLELGSGQFIPGFEEQMIGKNKGDEFIVKVTFPENYQNEDFAGEDAEFKVVIKGVKEKIKPELDDDFVMDVSEFDTLAEYREHIKKQIEEQLEEEVKREFQSNVLDAFLTKIDLEVNEKVLNHEIRRELESRIKELEMYGINPQEFLNSVGGYEAYAASQKEVVSRSILLRSALSKISELENIEITDEYAFEDTKKQFEGSGMTEEQIKTRFEEIKPYIVDNLKVQKGQEFLFENAVAIDVVEE